MPPPPLLPSVQRVERLVVAVLGHLHQLVDGVQQAVAVLPQQLLVEPLVSEAHLKQHGHQGGVLPGGRVDASLEREGGGDDDVDACLPFVLKMFPIHQNQSDWKPALRFHDAFLFIVLKGTGSKSSRK